jgi:DNA-directed RNA polymerase subunit H (RpoH/RPB5)
MSAINNEVYNAYDGIIDMLNNRGNKFNKLSYNEFFNKYNKKEIENVINIGDYSISFFPIFKSVGKNEIISIIKSSQNNLMLIKKEKITPHAYEEINKIKDAINIEIFDSKQFYIPINHFFQPKWEKLSFPEMKQVCKAYKLTTWETDEDGTEKLKIKPNKALLMFPNDPIFKYYNSKPGNTQQFGDMFRVLRQDNTPAYRYCHEDLF